MVLSEPRSPVYRAARHRRADGIACITVEDYHAMIAAGIYGEDDKIELIGGQLYEKMPINPPHAFSVYACVNRLRQLAAPDELIVFQERPVIVDAVSELQPDIVVVTMRRDFYSRAHPKATDVVVVAEVADETLRRDRRIKLPRYAAAGIPEYWIVNLRQRQLERYTEPEAGQPELELEARYGKTEVYTDGDTLIHPGLGEIVFAELLPAAE